MSEIYMKKKVFWKEESNSRRNKNILVLAVIAVIVILSLILLTKKNKIIKIDKNRTKYYSDYLKKNILKFNSLIYKMYSTSNGNIKSQNTNTNSEPDFSDFSKTGIKKIKKLNPGNKKDPIYISYNPLIQSKIYEENKYGQKFYQEIISFLFIKCGTNLISYEIEIYYEFSLYAKKLEFEVEGNYTDDVNMFNDNLCFSSGKASIALKTSLTPKCLEVQNLSIANFLYENKTSSNISLKLHIFRVNNHKIHIYPLAEQILSVKHFKVYLEGTSTDFYHLDKNLLIYQNEKGDKLLRICNFFSQGEDIYYENKLWLEVNWDPQIQNFLCFENFAYFG